MKYLYLYLNIGSFLIPFIFSFHPRLQFYKKWKSFFIGVLVMMLVFIPWDIVFTYQGFWGFNEKYISGIKFLNLPLEEWLFFICIPYACIFTHYALLELNPNFKIPEKVTKWVYFFILIILTIVLWYHFNKWYTLVNFIYGIAVLGIAYHYIKEKLPYFFATFLIILIPFFIVNGVLTGTAIQEQVVWYNNEENLGIRLGTIPIEDIIYNLGMLLTIFLVMEKINQYKKA